MEVGYFSGARFSERSEYVEDNEWPDCPNNIEAWWKCGKGEDFCGENFFMSTSEWLQSSYGRKSGEQRVYQHVWIWFGTKTVHKEILVYQFLAEKKYQHWNLFHTHARSCCMLLSSYPRIQKFTQKNLFSVSWGHTWENGKVTYSTSSTLTEWLRGMLRGMKGPYTKVSFLWKLFLRD